MGPSSDIQERKLSNLRDDIEPILTQFWQAALKREDLRQEAIEALYNLAMTSMRMLHEFPLEDLRSFARTKYIFPFPAYQHPDSLRWVQDFMANLQLGESAPVNMRAKSKGGKARFRLTTPVAQMAFAYRQRLELIRHISPDGGLRVLSEGKRTVPKGLLESICALQAFSAQTVAAWCACAWEVVLLDHDGHPERSKIYRQLGIDRVKSSKGAPKGRGEPGSKTYESNIRDGIHRRFKEGFSRLAAGA